MHSKAKHLNPFLFLLLLCLARPAAAQEPPISVGVGYQYLHGAGSGFPMGITATVAFGFGGHFAVTSEVGWAEDRSAVFGLHDVRTAWHLAGGVKWGQRGSHRLRLFGQILVGAERSAREIEEFGTDSAWNPMIQPGGGLSFRVRGRRDLFVQVDWRRVSTDDRVNALRVATGVRF